MFSLNSMATAAIARELDVCALRHEVYSANIANVDVQGYERLDVMRQAAEEPINSSRNSNITDLSNEAISAMQVVSTHESVKLDQELAKLSKNALRYETLLTAYQQTTGILSLAIKDGRGA